MENSDNRSDLPTNTCRSFTIIEMVHVITYKTKGRENLLASSFFRCNRPLLKYELKKINDLQFMYSYISSVSQILYTGKEGKTTQGCPMAKWIIRRASLDEKVLVVVKHRPGHRCSTAWIVVVLVAWEGVSQNESDHLYNVLVHKLNKYVSFRECFIVHWLYSKHNRIRISCPVDSVYLHYVDAPLTNQEHARVKD